MHTDAVHVFGSASTFVRLVADAAVTAEATVCVEGAPSACACWQWVPCGLAAAAHVALLHVRAVAAPCIRAMDIG